MANLPNFNEKIEGKMKINEITFDLSLGVTQFTDGKIDRLLEGISEIRNVKIKGMIADCGENVKYIERKMREHSIDVENVNIEVTM